jgi:hypothetical protein
MEKQSNYVIKAGFKIYCILKVFIILIIEVGMKIVCIDDTLPQ